MRVGAILSRLSVGWDGRGFWVGAQVIKACASLSYGDDYTSITNRPMGQGLAAYPGYRQWGEGGGRGTLKDYQNWLRANGYASGDDFVRALNANQGAMTGGQLSNPLTGSPYPAPNPSSIPVPGQTPQTSQTPSGRGGFLGNLGRVINELLPRSNPAPAPPAPLTPLPPAQTSAPAFAPPQVQVPALLGNPAPQGLGGMPMLRDRMMAATLAPFAQANWGVPQVDPRYLTQQVRLAGGATPADVMVVGNPLGIGGAGAPALGYPSGGKPNVRIPRVPPTSDPRAYK